MHHRAWSIRMVRWFTLEIQCVSIQSLVDQRPVGTSGRNGKPPVYVRPQNWLEPVLLWSGIIFSVKNPCKYCTILRKTSDCSRKDLSFLGRAKTLGSSPWCGRARCPSTKLIHVGSWRPVLTLKAIASSCQGHGIDLPGRSSYMVLGLQVLTHPHMAFDCWRTILHTLKCVENEWVCVCVRVHKPHGSGKIAAISCCSLPRREEVQQILCMQACTHLIWLGWTPNCRKSAATWTLRWTPGLAFRVFFLLGFYSPSKVWPWTETTPPGDARSHQCVLHILHRHVQDVVVRGHVSGGIMYVVIAIRLEAIAMILKRGSSCCYLSRVLGNDAEDGATGERSRGWRSFQHRSRLHQWVREDQSHGLGEWRV